MNNALPEWDMLFAVLYDDRPGARGEARMLAFYEGRSARELQGGLHAPEIEAVLARLATDKRFVQFDYLWLDGRRKFEVIPQEPPEDWIIRFEPVRRHMEEVFAPQLIAEGAQAWLELSVPAARHSGERAGVARRA